VAELPDGERQPDPYREIWHDRAKVWVDRSHRLATGGFWRIHPQSAPAFTAAQYDAGRAAYSENCSACHGDNLDGRFAPPLRGLGFRQKWSGKTLDELFAYMRDKMPPERPGAMGLPQPGSGTSSIS